MMLTATSLSTRLFARLAASFFAQTRSWRVFGAGLGVALLGVLGACGGGEPLPEQTPTPAAVARVEISPKATLLSAPGQSARFTATAYDANGNVVAANFTWRSGKAANASVDNTGQVTAVAASGTSQIVAETAGISAPPAFVLVAQPTAGTLLVGDAQILGAPVPLSSGSTTEPGFRYQVVLAGLPPLVNGQLVLGSGETPMGGRVVAVEAAGADQRVTLETVTPAELFTNLSVQETISLAQAPVTMSAAVQSHYDVQRHADGSMDFVARQVPRASSTAPGRKRAASIFSASMNGFECEATLPPATSLFPIALASGPIISTALPMALEIDYSSATGLKRLVLVGTPKFGLQIKPVVKNEFQSKITCGLDLFNVTLPLGAVGLFFGAWFPVGVGFEVAGKVGLDYAGLGLEAEAKVEYELKLGMACLIGCGMVNEAVNKSSAKWTLDWPSATVSPSLELSAEAFGKMDFVVGNYWLAGTFSFLSAKTFEAKLGLKQDLRLLPALAQATDPAKSAGFGLTAEAKLGAGAAINSLINTFSLPLVGASISLSHPLAAAPTGSFTITPASVLPGDSLSPGQPATFTVVLDKSTYLGVEAVEGIEFHWLKGNFLVPAPADCVSVPASTGQTTFTCTTSFVTGQEGTQTFYAFMKARLFGVLLPTLFEISNNAVAQVQVGNGGGRARLIVQTHRATVASINNSNVNYILDASYSGADNEAIDFDLDESATTTLETRPTLTGIAVSTQHAVELHSKFSGTADNLLGYTIAQSLDLQATKSFLLGGPALGQTYYVEVQGGVESVVVFEVIDGPVKFDITGAALAQADSHARSISTLNVAPLAVPGTTARLYKCASAPGPILSFVGDCFPSNEVPPPVTGTLAPGTYALHLSQSFGSGILRDDSMVAAGLTTLTSKAKAAGNLSITFSPAD